MHTATANELEEGKELTKRHAQQWFDWMDKILDIHRSNFLFREPKPERLPEHKKALKLAIRTSLLIHALISDPDFNEPELVSRLHVRIKQLEDAYAAFDESNLSNKEANQILQQVFPE